MNKELKHNCSSNCTGCNKKNKPKDCKSDGCTKCCSFKCHSPYNDLEKDFLINLLEKNFLPFIYLIDVDSIIYKHNKDTSIAEIKIYEQIIRNFEKTKILTIDFDFELDEYSYFDYLDYDIYNSNEFRRGCIAISEEGFNKFFNTAN